MLFRSKYCSKIVEETCEKYAYKKPKFISMLSQYVETQYVEMQITNPLSSCYALNYYLLGVMVVILTHATNKKYKEILETINETMYPTCKSDERAVIMLITHLLNAPRYRIYGSCYTWETKRLFNMVAMIHLFKITENQFLKNNNFRKTREEKVAMLKYEFNTDKLIPKYFKEAILQLK